MYQRRDTRLPPVPAHFGVGDRPIRPTIWNLGIHIFRVGRLVHDWQGLHRHDQKSPIHEQNGEERHRNIRVVQDERSRLR